MAFTDDCHADGHAVPGEDVLFQDGKLLKINWTVDDEEPQVVRRLIDKLDRLFRRPNKAVWMQCRQSDSPETDKGPARRKDGSARSMHRQRVSELLRGASKTWPISPQ